MIKALNTAILLSTVIVCHPAYAEKTIQLGPNQTKQFTNPLAWTVNATCNIQSNNTHARIRVQVVNNTGQVNGHHLNQGQATSISVKHNSTISLSAEPGTQVNLVNTGSEPIQAICSA